MESSPTELDVLPEFFFDALDFLSPDETLDLDLALDSSSDSTKPPDNPSSTLSPPLSSVRLRRRRRSSTGGVDNSWSDREERRSTVTVTAAAAATETDHAASSSPDGVDESLLDFLSPDETLDLALDSSSDSTKLPDNPSSNLSPPPSSVRLRRRRRSSTGAVDNSWSDREERRSTVTATAAAAVTETDHAVSSSPDGADGSLLVSAAGFLISALFFQFNLIATFFAAPFRLLHFAFSLAFDPFGTLNRSRNSINGRLFSVWNGLVARIGSVVGNQQDVGKLAIRLALGCFWSAYVGFVLLWVLVTAFVGGGLLMRTIVEEPMHMVRDLSFDYTKPSPAALVPLDSRDGPAVLSGRRLQMVVTLTLPESDYNQKLGVFQVRVELLSRNGKVTYSSSQPCMLRFKSNYIRLVETFLKSGSLLAGYSSEAQVLRIKMTGLVEGTEPTVCIRVILEPRAEYRPGAGIPQIYSASLKVETELPFLRRILWNWRRTVFIWVVMVLFVLEILIVLIFCSPIIIPRIRPSSESPSRTQQ